MSKKKKKQMCGLMEYLGYTHGATQVSGIVNYNLEFALQYLEIDSHLFYYLSIMCAAMYILQD